MEKTIENNYIELIIGNLKADTNTYPNINLSNLVRIMKLYTTYHIWKHR